MWTFWKPIQVEIFDIEELFNGGEKINPILLHAYKTHGTNFQKNTQLKTNYFSHNFTYLKMVLEKSKSWLCPQKCNKYKNH
jgi:hypothetical protein